MTFSTETLVIETGTRSAKDVFFDLFDGHASEREMEGATHYLAEQLEKAEALDSDLPDDMRALTAWMETGVSEVGHQYHQYLEERHAGGERRYFRNKSHALYFLKSVAPTKLVDGAWLYGLLPRWQDPRFLALIQTYLEELGEGLPTLNHVVLYRKLLATQGCERWDDLADENYVQGAIQLALAYHAEQFLPEVIGFNLGYEQLPLHLLITAYELKELGIDPYYFTLHVTVDNADSGHAKKAVDAISDAMPRLGDPQDFYRRVQNGYKLNLLGANTSSVIESFDIEQELVSIFRRKGAVGQYAHSDYRRVADRTVNDWLSDASQTEDFLAAMEQGGWFKRHQDPRNSRFWKLIESEKAKMFGVFNAYERQVIYDWIAGDATGIPRLETKIAQHPSSPTTPKEAQSPHKETPILEHQELRGLTADSSNDFDADVHALKANLAAATNQEEAVGMLIELMSPANHHTAPGLMATRIFNDMLG